MHKELETIGLEVLKNSLVPLPHEKNELDWKSDLSQKGDKIAQHLSAFSNLQAGGFLVFGISDAGVPQGVRETSYVEIVKKLGNIARDGLTPSITIDHSVVTYDGVGLLLVYISESPEKPVYLRGGTIYDSYLRSAGQTRKMTKQEVARVIARSAGSSVEHDNASPELSADEIVKRIDIQAFFDLLSQPFPQDINAIIANLEADNIIKRVGRSFVITNLGALLFAKDLRQFEHLKRKSARVVEYEHSDRLRTRKEQEFFKGYAAGFEGLIQYVLDQTPRNEVIEKALRREVKMYPPLSIRELVANALIHQDLNEIGTGPIIEIFSDRIEITNPGRPLVSTIRFIDSPPQSRNEAVAAFMRRTNICEERGSGIDKVIFEVEVYQLPAPEFVETDNHTKATLFAHRTLAKMARIDKIRACYQHCCLKYVSGSRMSNNTLRKRFNIEEKNYAIASRIIGDTIEAKLIKPSDAHSRSKKYATYIPFWA